MSGSLTFRAMMRMRRASGIGTICVVRLIHKRWHSRRRRKVGHTHVGVFTKSQLNEHIFPVVTIELSGVMWRRYIAVRIMDGLTRATGDEGTPTMRFSCIAGHRVRLNRCARGGMMSIGIRVGMK